MNRLRIGTRGSRLSLAQTDWVVNRLQARFPQLSVETITVKTTGDRFEETPIPQLARTAVSASSTKGLFTKEIEEALLDGRIDVAVHSLKDLTSELPAGLTLGAVTEREDPRDCLISREGMPFNELPTGGVIGTSSFRRRVQLLQLRPDICVVELRGNLDTRLRRLHEGQCDALVVAFAGVKRLGREAEVTEIFPLEQVLPAVGQGSLALELRSLNSEVSRYVGPLDHQPSRLAALAERAFQHRLEGGCQVPLGAYAWLEGAVGDAPGVAALHMRGFIADLEGQEVIASSCQGSLDQPEPLGRQLAEQLLAQGADRIVAAIRVRRT
ncbi:MAG: hydroxymethylbilane synthase [Elusimicrobia bacterium]|nr:hydroxymethylbilane synthase [Elusimicrobiota bacterium]